MNLKELRNYIMKIRFDLKGKIIEIDYSGLHIILLYALEGIDYWKEVKNDPKLFWDDNSPQKIFCYILLTN